MQFWIRHAVLIATCVVLPFVAALYVDTQSEVDRAGRSAALGAKFAAANLESRLTLDAHRHVNAAISMAQEVTDREVFLDLAKKPNATSALEKKREAAVQTVAQLLASGAPEGGFAWLVDDTGAIIARSGAPGLDDKPELIGGHPLFLDTQEGFAIDGLWREGGKLAMVGAAPVVSGTQAAGAVIVGKPIDRGVVDALSASLNCGITLLGDDQILATTLEPGTASDIVASLASATESFTRGGALAQPLRHAYLPILPLFLAHDAKGFAFTSIAQRAPGADGVRWVISQPSGEGLRDIADRQEVILGGLVAFFMVALLIGMITNRTFVRPIARITDHLSDLQQGRGELELSEARVSAPYRRLVKLINMMVQRIPSRTFTSARTAPAESPISEIGANLPQLSQLPMSMASVSQPPAAAREPVRAQPAVDPIASASAPPPALGGGGILGIPRAQSAIERHPFEGGGDILGEAVAALAQARAPGASDSMSPPPYASARPAASSGGDDEEDGYEPRNGRSEEDEDDAIAQAIAALEGGQAPASSPPPARTSPPQSASRDPSTRGGASGGYGAARSEDPSQTGRFRADSLAASRVRSAADIRGVPSESLLGAPSPFVPAAAEYFRGGAASPLGPRTDSQLEDPTPSEPVAAVPRGYSTTARSGGSLNLESYAGIGQSAPVEAGGFNPEATVVAPVADELLRQSAAREDATDHHAVLPGVLSGDSTMVASVPPNLLAQTMGDSEGDTEAPELFGLDAADHAHFKETYERFIEMRKRCGEATGDLAFDRFLAKLAKNREGLIKKYNCRTVRFQVYEKDGKAALKATPVRAR